MLIWNVGSNYSSSSSSTSPTSSPLTVLNPSSSSNSNKLDFNVDSILPSSSFSSSSSSSSPSTVYHPYSSQSSSSSSAVQYILHQHTRAVSDIHWSPFHPTIIATCSYDSYLHIWDLKSPPTKPVTSVCTWTAGATQVKWNKTNEWLIASVNPTNSIILVYLFSQHLFIYSSHMIQIYASGIFEKELPP